MASIRRQLLVNKPRSEVLAAVLASLGPAFQRQGYSVDSQSSEGVMFVRRRSIGHGILGLLATPKTIAVNVGDKDGATLITIVGQGPQRLKRAIDAF